MGIRPNPGSPSLLPAVATPFEEDELAPRRLGRTVAALVAAGVDGALVLGSTGEGRLVSSAERTVAVTAARAVLGDGRLLLAGVWAEATRAAAREAREAAEAGADAVLVSTPHYYAAEMSEEALVRHFATVADRSPVPVLLYNVPKFTALAIPPRAVGRLARHGNVAGMKESSGDLAYLRRVLEEVGPSFGVLCGAGALVLDALEAGASGAILAAAAVAPEPFVDLLDAWRRGDGEAAAAHAARATAVERWATARGIAGIKGALDLRGLDGGSPRPPLLAADDATREAMAEALDVLVASGVLPGRGLRARAQPQIDRS